MSKLFGYFLLFITIFVAIVVISYMLKKFFRVIKMGWVDRLGGAGFGLLKSTVILSLLLNVVISIVPMTSGFYKTMVNSPVSSKIIALNPYIMTIIDKLSGNKKDIPFINPKKVL
jgi:membrane protein required for colicin V production